MHITSFETTARPAGRPLRLAVALALAAVLSACGGGGSSGSDSSGSDSSGSGSGSSTVMVTPNDPATAGPPASALTPPGGDASSPTPARRPETVRCAP